MEEQTGERHLSSNILTVQEVLSAARNRQGVWVLALSVGPWLFVGWGVPSGFLGSGLTRLTG